MFYHFFYPLSSDYPIFNVFRYITFRAAYSGVTALVLSLILGTYMIRLLQKYQIGEKIRKHGPQHHNVKSGTPTMGGVLILFTFLLSTLLWANLSNSYIWIIIFSAVGFGAVGLYDDIVKLKSGDGLSVKTKLLCQTLLALVIGIYLVYFDPSRMEYATTLSVPFFKQLQPDLGVGYLFFIVFIIVGTSNAVNLTDGLDGLAIGPIIIATLTYTGIVYLSGAFQVRRISGHSTHPRSRRDDHCVHSRYRGQPGFSLVQLLSSASVYGRCRFLVSRRHSGNHRRNRQTRTAFDPGGGNFCDRSTFRHHPGRLFQIQRR